jgi:hypothetical protein
MLLSVDDAEASLFNVPDAQALDKQRATITDKQGLAYGRATLRAVSPSAVRVEELDEFAPADRYRIRDTAAVQGLAVRIRGVEERREQAAFRERVGNACDWACVITGETVREVLDAAHLPGSSWRARDNAASDGVLLRADLHRLLDAGLLRIEDGVVRVSVGDYSSFDGRKANMPVDRRAGSRLDSARE